MERLVFDSLRWGIRIVLWSAGAPLLIARQLSRAMRRLAGARLLATNDALPCAGCGAPVSLVSRFECGRCRYVFDGFAFARCAICGAVPPYIVCQTCGVGLRNPVP